MSQATHTIEVLCFPTLEWPASREEILDHFARRDYVEAELRKIPEAEHTQATINFLWYSYMPYEGYERPFVSPDQRAEWRARQLHPRFVVKKRSQ
ncbi:MAG: hypothetical protein JSS66_07880 [Armatimonadetes bacterium]|nr:hypothetical protein [Armatimonadota bacterium]